MAERSVSPSNASCGVFVKVTNALNGEIMLQETEIDLRICVDFRHKIIGFDLQMLIHVIRQKLIGPMYDPRQHQIKFFRDGKLIPSDGGALCEEPWFGVAGSRHQLELTTVRSDAPLRERGLTFAARTVQRFREAIPDLRLHPDQPKCQLWNITQDLLHTLSERPPITWKVAKAWELTDRMRQDSTAFDRPHMPPQLNVLCQDMCNAIKEVTILALHVKGDGALLCGGDDETVFEWHLKDVFGYVYVHHVPGDRPVPVATLSTFLLAWRNICRLGRGEFSAFKYQVQKIFGRLGMQELEDLWLAYEAIGSRQPRRSMEPEGYQSESDSS